MGGLVAGLISLVFAPFLVRRINPGTSFFEIKRLVLVVGLTGVVLGALAGVVAKLGAALLRRPDDPPPRRPAGRISLGALYGALVGGFFGFSLEPVFMVALSRFENTRILLTAGKFLLLSTTVGVSFGIAAAALVVAFVPSIAPVHRVARVRVQHLYEGPVTNMNELAVLVNRIREGGEDALAAGKEFHLT